MELQTTLKKYNLSQPGNDKVLNVNGHIHTPYSFSAFKNIQQAVEMAKKEDIKILGINDFFVADGYKEFKGTCEDNGIYPLFNIEFIGLIQDFQDQGIRVNDPGNPGRVYFSGKGLNYPFRLDQKLTEKLDIVKKESVNQVEQMVIKAGHFFKEQGLDIQLDFQVIKDKYAEDLVRERHIAKAISIAVDEKTHSTEEKKALLHKVYGGKGSQVDVNDNNALENEIRNNLLKAGGIAFVPEDPKAFLPLEEIIGIIVNAGGIPCYPVLLDALKGAYTDFEGDWEKMHHKLTELNVRCVELIPGRNSLGELEKFVKFFYDRGYIVLLGTEHNTPELIPITVYAGGNTELSDYLKKTSYESSCVLAAHQFLSANGEEGYVDGMGLTKSNQRETFIGFGKAVLNQFFKNH
jgi:hypothetical protein